MNVFKKAPNGVVVVCGAIVIVAVLASIVILTVYNKSTADVFKLLTACLSGLGVVSSVGSLMYAGAAAKQADTAVQQTNGPLTQRITEVVNTAMAPEKIQALVNNVLTAHNATVITSPPDIGPPSVTVTPGTVQSSGSGTG